ncbi:hypothetical protein ABB37_05021 [Leptomonas pyrrhocoris]|uniref:Uncharacterized protein n=1 Tax=Leptomonas pyrrhocoris TaxID=157538 RepID=A0A0N0DVE1_LEPPY|nr:hypothetical protein ABB37_05021 [Leptomonas pyrrhocoris]KPA79981.1 hypothetical protein ABB37_05021 [Leptomonas pyrrhocoris]|eukprot:XP_015658420.1 hypothetical protein ABB37_05021 [Leptomonas pyrrhocoris]
MSMLRHRDRRSDRLFFFPEVFVPEKLLLCPLRCSTCRGLPRQLYTHILKTSQKCVRVCVLMLSRLDLIFFFFFPAQTSSVSDFVTHTLNLVTSRYWGDE